MKYFFATVFVLASAVQLYASYKINPRLKAGSKGFVMASLLGFYVTAAPELRGAIIIALVFSLLGDMLLIKSSWLVFGGVAFGMAHFAYIFAYCQQISFGAIPVWIYIAAAVAYVAAIFAMLRFLWPYVSKRLKIAGTVYLTNISLMSYFALLQLLSLKTPYSAVVYLGSLIFILSDFILLIRNFRAEVRIKHKPFLVMLTYIVAQVLIVWGMMRIG